MLDKLVAEAGVSEVIEDNSSSGSEYDDDKGNEELVDWLKEWEAKNTVANCVKDWLKAM
jgi:hypothetical protein